MIAQTIGVVQSRTPVIFIVALLVEEVDAALGSAS